MLELASIYRPTKYHLPVSVTNSASPCLAAPSSVYPLLPPITIHLPYCTTSRQLAKTPQVEICPAARPQRSLAHPQTTPVYGPRVPISRLRSESRRPNRPHAGHQFRNPNAGHTRRPTSESLSPEGYDAPLPNGAITGLTSPRYLKEDRPRSRNTAEARTKPEAAPRCDRLEAVESGSRHAAGLHRKLIPKRSRHPEAKGDKTPRRRGRTSS